MYTKRVNLKILFYSIDEHILVSNKLIVRCNKCQNAHLINVRESDNDQSSSFYCKCGMKITGNYENKQLIVTGGTLSERKQDEPVYVHEAELKQQ